MNISPSCILLPSLHGCGRATCPWQISGALPWFFSLWRFKLHFLTVTGALLWFLLLWCSKFHFLTVTAWVWMRSLSMTNFRSTSMFFIIMALQVAFSYRHCMVADALPVHDSFQEHFYDFSHYGAPSCIFLPSIWHSGHSFNFAMNV